MRAKGDVVRGEGGTALRRASLSVHCLKRRCRGCNEAGSAGKVTLQSPLDVMMMALPRVRPFAEVRVYLGLALTRLFMILVRTIVSWLVRLVGMDYSSHRQAYAMD